MIFVEPTGRGRKPGGINHPRPGEVGCTSQRPLRRPSAARIPPPQYGLVQFIPLYLSPENKKAAGYPAAWCPLRSRPLCYWVASGSALTSSARTTSSASNCSVSGFQLSHVMSVSVSVGVSRITQTSSRVMGNCSVTS